MKDLVEKKNNNIGLFSKDIASAISLHIFMAALGFIASRGVIFSSLMPFGLAFTGGCGTLFLPSVTIGCFIGYFFPAAGVGGFKYIATLFSIVAIRLLLSGYKKLCENPLFLSGVAAVANAITGIITYSGVALDTIKLAAECLIVFGGVFIVWRALNLQIEKTAGLDVEELFCLLGTVCIILIGMFNFNVFDISIGRVLGVFLILVSAKFGGASASNACGISVTFAAAITGSFESGFGIYAFAGLAAGIFGSLGKYAQAVAVVATGLIGISFMKFSNGSALFLTEILIGAFCFLLIPRSASYSIGKFFYRQPKVSAQNSAGKALGLRLNLASCALMDVSSTVSQVSNELSKINAPDFKSVLSYIEQDACAGCKLRIHCWENKTADTTEAVLKMINIIKGADEPIGDNTLEQFRGRCLRVKKMEDTIKNRYTQYASLIAAENRIDEVRQVVSEQFEGISNMLGELALDFSCGEQFDGHAAQAAASALKNIGVRVIECAAKVDAFGRMSLEMKIDISSDTVLNRLQIMKLLSVACERDFDVPNLTKTDNCVLLTVNEHPRYRIDIGVEQRCAVAGTICGDSYKFFNDGKGHFLMVLSDGMGTGGRAAVDGAMASGLMAQLLKSGFGFDCSLKILNSSMLFKSSDESLATMDIASIDLFTGNAELYKAGAAPTIVRKNGRSGRAESQNLPIGILKNVSFDRAGIRLHSGDILLLVSDGVTFDGTEWIRKELENWRDGGAQDLAEHICDCAHRRNSNERHDDITVMAAILEKTI